MSAEEKPAGGDKGGKKSGGLLNAWGYSILLIVLVMVNIIGMLTGQIGGFLQMLKFNGGVIMAGAALFFIAKGLGAFKKGGDHH